MHAHVCVGGDVKRLCDIVFYPDDGKTAVKRVGGGEFVFNRCVCLTDVTVGCVRCFRPVGAPAATSCSRGRVWK